jgi:signal transduction histidine kinase
MTVNRALAIICGVMVVLVASALLAVKAAGTDSDGQLVAAIVLAELCAFGLLGAGGWRIARRRRDQRLRALDDPIARFATGDWSARAPEDRRDEVGRIAATLNMMADELARQKEREALFLAEMAHDLRNPLSVIKGSIDLLGERTSRQIEAIERMLADVMQRRQLQSGTEDPELGSCDVRRLAADVVEQQRSTASSHQLELTAPDEAVVARCVAPQIERVLANLVGNAIKYSPDGGPIAVEVAADDRHAILSIRDSGLGIAPDDLGRIFEPFYRSPQASPGIDGMGLGLAAVKRIVEEHEGLVEVESELGRGSAFRVRLPLADSRLGRPH